MTQVVQVCVLHTNRDYFDYTSTVEPSLGARVWVPFRTTTRLGIVVGVQASTHCNKPLKSITTVIDDEPMIPKELLSLCHWISQYYQSPLSEILPLALPKKYRQGAACQLPQIESYQLTVSAGSAHQKIGVRATRQHALIDFLSNRLDPVPKKTILQAGFNTSLLNALHIAQVLKRCESIDIPLIQEAPIEAPLPVNKEQGIAIQSIVEHLSSYRCFLLQGVTGSGKTEVYLQVIVHVLALGRQVLILVPEIGLTPQLLARFTARFHVPIAVFHSNLNDTQRQAAWQLARDNHVKLVIGTRSALFTPMPALGLIVIDEEHDASFKQMDGVRYHARDAALMRAHATNIPIILGSATPSLESINNYLRQKYTLLRLTQKALNSPPLYFEIIDIRTQVLTHGITARTLAVIKTHLAQDNQVLVFINRRGFAPVMLCHHCGWMADCRACDSHLTLHKDSHQVVCHHCGLRQSVPKQCPNCQHRELVPVGIGTQRVFNYLASECPKITMVRIDRDEVSQKYALETHLARINSGEAQLMVGTQLLAKGHHFPRLTLVVVLDADNGFYNQDFRALEQLGQLLTQVAGRAGRAEFPGQVLIQTHLPHHPLLNQLIQEGYEAFAQTLLLSRREANLPPYYFLAVIRAQATQVERVLTFLHAIKEAMVTHPVTVLGPAPAPLARKAHQHRLQLLVKASSRITLAAALKHMRTHAALATIGTGVRWNIDVDPMDLS
jgi:primosomal protein N' (replication factor Y) (superfamily II helicase)